MRHQGYWWRQQRRPTRLSGIRRLPLIPGQLCLRAPPRLGSPWVVVHCNSWGLHRRPTIRWASFPRGRGLWTCVANPGCLLQAEVKRQRREGAQEATLQALIDGMKAAATFQATMRKILDTLASEAGRAASLAAEVALVVCEEECAWELGGSPPEPEGFESVEVEPDLLQQVKSALDAMQLPATAVSQQYQDDVAALQQLLRAIKASPGGTRELLPLLHVRVYPPYDAGDHGRCDPGKQQPGKVAGARGQGGLKDGAHLPRHEQRLCPCLWPTRWRGCCRWHEWE